MTAARDRTALAGSAPRSATGAVRALAVALVAPGLWFLHLNVVYVLVPPSCRWGHRWAFAAATVVALAGMAPAARRSWRTWRGRDDRDDDGGLVGFLGLVGVCLAALFALTTVLVASSAAVVGPCR